MTSVGVVIRRTIILWYAFRNVSKSDHPTERLANMRRRGDFRENAFDETF
jgi:hypothetical protein